ncbi:glycosyltransferase [Nostoc sp. NMS4]|uniref:glycosyltransferase family 4 protein n=1 Tax=Nostoc sp. NMS4 TaxID=2815390 RepID=UPI0025FE3B2A|nr:glycosyltransferase [Nostoc sp. NMS4]MBN3924813.1 glycosyltransferase [Nostoc sp. NMS4]
MSTNLNDRHKSTILFITTGLEAAGAEIMLYNLLSKINRQQFSPIVVSLMNWDIIGDYLKSLEIPVYTMSMKQGFPTPFVIGRLISIVRKIKPDLIQGWMYHGNFAAQFASCFLDYNKIPVLWSIHSSIHEIKSYKFITKNIIKFGAYISQLPKKILFVSQASKLQHEALGYSSNNSYIIPNGFDTSLFIPSDEARSSFRLEMGLSDKSFLIGLIGRYHPMKDHENFLRAASLLLKKYPDIIFVLAGRGVAEENQILKQLIKELEIVNHIYLLGERNDMPRLMASLDIVTSASAYGEAFPMVIGEAMSCAVPCVVTDVGDSAWLVGDTGKVVPPKNPQLLANAFKELIDLEYKDRKILGKAARERVINLFSLDSVVHQYESLYKTLLDYKK